MTALNFMRAGFIVLLLAFMVFVPIAVPLGTGIPVVLGLVLFLFLIAYYHARHTTYVCIKCTKSFKITGWMDLTTPHAISTKLLVCPHCGVTAWHRAQE